MPVLVKLDNSLDKEYENKSLKELLDAPPSALAGVSEEDAAALAKAFNIKTVRQLGANKPFAVAAALVTLENAG
jgi:hypothetical protein